MTLDLNEVINRPTNFVNIGRAEYYIKIGTVFLATRTRPKFAQTHDFLKWCFGDVRARAEWEFMVCPWGGLREEDRVVDVGIKVDTYRMYVEPNAKHLRELVDSVSVSSAKKFLAEERNRYRQVRLKNGA